MFDEVIKCPSNQVSQDGPRRDLLVGVSAAAVRCPPDHFPQGEREERVGINNQVRLKPYDKGAENLVCKSQVGFVIRKVKIKTKTSRKKSYPPSSEDSGEKPNTSWLV